MIVTKKAGISEIFSSLQGEGTHMGERHLFVRFAHCNIHCEYCDELDKPGTDLDIETVLGQIRQIDEESGPHAFISLTGGEPLLYHSFLKHLCPLLRAHQHRLYLETNGILDRALKDVIEWIDVIAMDMKPSSVTKERNYSDEHKRFLDQAKQKELFVKIVVSKEIDIEEFLECVKIVHSKAREIPVILQPISTKEREGHEDSELMRLLNELQQVARSYLNDVRIIPRLHKILKIK